MAIDYEKMFSDLVRQHDDLVQRRDAIDSELASLKPFLQSAYNMLTLAQRVRLSEKINNINTQNPGLKDGVLMAFKARSGEWLTPPDIRDYLESIGFDFGADSARGLTSVGTTLRRMVPELETKEMGNGQIAYRRKMTFGERIARPRPEKTPGQQVKDLKAILEKHK